MFSWLICPWIKDFFPDFLITTLTRGTTWLLSLSWDFHLTLPVHQYWRYCHDNTYSFKVKNSRQNNAIQTSSSVKHYTCSFFSFFRSQGFSIGSIMFMLNTKPDKSSRTMFLTSWHATVLLIPISCYSLSHMRLYSSIYCCLVHLRIIFASFIWNGRCWHDP